MAVTTEVNTINSTTEQQTTENRRTIANIAHAPRGGRTRKMNTVLSAINTGLSRNKAMFQRTCNDSRHVSKGRGKKMCDVAKVTFSRKCSISL